MNNSFVYEKAFSRNLGLVSIEEQNQIKHFKVAIPGMGGVGGVHLINLLRLGYSKFHLADFDEFGIENFNRQYGANINSVGKKKLDVMREMAFEINPDVEIDCFDKGITEDNLDQFFEGVDIVFDSLDVFTIKIRRIMVNEAVARGIPVIIAGPIGMGTSYTIFDGKGFNFDDHFRTHENMSDLDLLIHFLVGLSPKLLHVRYLINEYISLKDEKVPSLNSSVYLAAGVAGIESLKVLLGRGRVLSAPYACQYDVYTNRYSKTKLKGRISTWIIKLKVLLIKIRLRSLLI